MRRPRPSAIQRRFAPLQQCALPDPLAVPPTIKEDSDHYAFAAYVVTGFTYADVCDLLGINVRTAQRWRTELCREAALYFGRTVSYEFAAQWVLDASFRAAFQEQMLRAQSMMQARANTNAILTSAVAGNASAQAARNRSNRH